MNYKKEIAPLPEGFADAISRTINKLQHMQEAPASRKSDRSDGDTKPQDISGEEEKVSADKKFPARKGDKSQGEAMASIKEETEALEEVRNIKIAKDGKDEKMVNKQELKTYLQMGWKEVKEEAELDEAGCISSSYKKEKKEEIDAVNPKAVKKKFDDREDKDIDNDGDEDESDEYLHKRRKAISKALSKDESVKKPNASVDESAELEGLNERFSPREIKMAIGIASDKRYAGGNMTGAVKAINKLKRGLSDHPQVSAVLKRQNEELDEVLDDPKAMDRYRSKAKYSSDRARNSATAKIVRGKGDYSGEKNTIRKREKGLDMVDRNAGRKLRKSLRREEVELDEAKPPQIQKGKAKGSISATGMRGKGNKKYDVMVGFDNGKFSFRITDEGGRFQTVGIKQASKMLGEENVNSLGLQELTSAEKKLINQMYDKKGNLTPIGKKVMDQGKAASKLSPKDIIKDKARRKEYTAFQKSKRNEELDEAKKSDYTIYHKTFSSAVQHAIDVSKKRGFEVDEDDWDRKVAMGPRKPGRGKTNSYTIDLMKSGKSVKNKLQMQVYYDEGRYELNMYIS